MRRSRLPAVLVIMGLIANGCAGREVAGPPNEKSPVLATVLAVFPGIFVHGLGNLYAGNTSRAEELMGEEGIGIVGLGVAVGLGFLGYSEHVRAEKTDGVESILARFGEVGSFLGTAVGLVLGIYFFHSWFADIAEAGDAASEHNKESRRLYEETQTVPADSAADVTTAGAPRSP